MRKKTIKERLQEGSFNTVRVIGMGFLFVILIGAVLLWMPFSVTTPMKFTDALFTSVTAVCVTGLVTVTNTDVNRSSTNSTGISGRVFLS